MEKENARKQTLEQLHERRKQVVRLHKKGIKVMQIVALTGLSYRPFAPRLTALKQEAGVPFDPPCGVAAEVMVVCSAKCKKTRFKR